MSHKAVSIDKSIAYWERYNLTLPGRINVAKSLLGVSTKLLRLLLNAVQDHT